jgi:hypothetical protein
MEVAQFDPAATLMVLPLQGVDIIFGSIVTLMLVA